MLSDAKILSYVVRDFARLFDRPRNRRELASQLRRVRRDNGSKAARLMLADLSARNLLATLS